MIAVISYVVIGICIGAAVGMTVQLMLDLRCVKDIQSIYEAEIRRIKSEYKHREHIRILKSNSEQTQCLISSPDWIDIEPLPISREWKDIDFGGHF